MADHSTSLEATTTHYLKTIECSPIFSSWMYETIKPYIKGDILEVGSGLGIYSRFLYRDFRGKLCLTDINENYVAELRREFPRHRVLVEKLDLGSRGDFQSLRIKGLRYDTIICMNVLEHVDDDVTALRELKRLLRDDGVLILLVPAHKSLYNSIDRAVGHFRRYSKQELVSKLRRAGFLICEVFYYDVFGIIGWYLNGNLLGRRNIDRRAFGFFNTLVPILRILDRLPPFRITGISVIALCVNSATRK